MKVLRILGILFAALAVPDLAEALQQVCYGRVIHYFCMTWYYSDQSLDCSGQSLTCIPSFNESPQPKLNFQRNQIETLPDYAFKTQFKVSNSLAEVTQLDLSVNKLSTIEPFAFAGLNSLKILDLNSNQLRKSPREALANVAGLTKLVLAFNPLQALHPQEFIDLIHLKELDLGYCRLGSIDPTAFEGLGRLESLVLKGNAIKVIQPGTFLYLRKLQTLNLAQNQISAFELNDIKGPLNLKVVALENNPVTIPADCIPCQPRWTGKLTLMLWDLHATMGSTRILQPDVFKFQISDPEKFDTIINLDLSSNQINQIDPGAFDGFRVLQNVSLSENQLTKVPIQALAEIRMLNTLSLSNNRLGPSLGSSRMFSELTNLKYLDLSYCGLKTIEESTFEGLRLLKLNLNENLIKVIKPNTFSHLRDLTTLDLSSNDLEVWEPDIIKGLDNLQSVRLENNPLKIPEDCLPCNPLWTGGKVVEGTWNLSSMGSQIKILKKDIFKHQILNQDAWPSLRCIETLDLSFNLISRIDSGAFSGFTRLTRLYLGDNKMMNFSTLAFRDIQQLEYLSFEGTPLGKITPHVFSALNKLTELDLSDCDLNVIEVNSFDGLISLKKLILDRNQLLMIKPLTFSNARNLESLHLSGNQIGSLAPDAFAGLPRLNFLDLSKNTVNLTEDEIKIILAFGVVPNIGEGQLDRIDLQPNVSLLANIPCNCDELKKLCVGTWGSTPEGELKCNLQRSLGFKLSKFVEVNVGEFVVSGFIMFMLALMVYQMISNYNSSPM